MKFKAVSFALIDKQVTEITNILILSDLFTEPFTCLVSASITLLALNPVFP